MRRGGIKNIIFMALSDAGDHIKLYLCLVMMYPQVSRRWSVYCCLFYILVKHLWSYHYEYRLVTVRTHDDLIVLPHWEFRLQPPWPDIPLKHIILTLSQPPCHILIMPCTWWKVSILKSFVWLHQGLNQWGSDSLISQNRRRMLCSTYSATCLFGRGREKYINI